MGAAAQFDRIGAVAFQGLAERQNPDRVAILLAEQADRAVIDGRIRGGDLGLRGRVLADHGVDLGLDPFKLRRRQGTAMAEVEAHALGIHQLALLRHMRAQNALQRRMGEVGGGVVGPRAGAVLVVHDQGDGGALGEHPTG